MAWTDDWHDAAVHEAQAIEALGADHSASLAKLLAALLHAIDRSRLPDGWAAFSTTASVRHLAIIEDVVMLCFSMRGSHVYVTGCADAMQSEHQLLQARQLGIDRLEEMLR